MATQRKISWTNASVRKLGTGIDPRETILKAARDLVLHARENGWDGPPFNPKKIADLLGVEIAANSSIPDARLVPNETGPRIEYNPQQPRERVRFSIAHELGHLLFPDWADQIRNRGGDERPGDDWQLEMLCNLAASEFVLPIGSLPSSLEFSTIEEIMRLRRTYDVSVEAFLIRLANVSSQPIGVFFASPKTGKKRAYRIEYYVSSPTAPMLNLSGIIIPPESAIHQCTAIGYTDRSIENWIDANGTQVEFVGIPGHPGSLFPRVAGLIRFDISKPDSQPIRFVHGSVLDLRDGDSERIVCQLVNDRATKWGGGVAKKLAQRFPNAEMNFRQNLFEIPQHERLGTTIFTRAEENLTIASMIAQEGYGSSSKPRIRYQALGKCIDQVTAHALKADANIHMPRIGTGAARGDWGTIEEMLENSLVRSGLSVTIYELPPKRVQLELFD